MPRSKAQPPAPAPAPDPALTAATAPLLANEATMSRADEPQALEVDDLLPSAFTPKQDQAIVALLAEPSIARAAVVVGVSERTIHRWLEDDMFARAFRKARREAFSQAIAACQRYTPLAVHALAKIVTDGSVQASARVSAASALLKFGRDSIELDDLASRIETLERTEHRKRREIWDD
ncbi:MAG: hypothetical protein U0640_11690 [Phycisphaerales bacterium]